MRLRDIAVEIGLIGLVFGVGVVASIYLQNPPLTGGLGSLGGYIILWVAMSKYKYDVWWAVQEDMTGTHRDENILSWRQE
jgi:hypothetical protein